MAIGLDEYDIWYITSLEDKGPGTLREAISNKDPKIVLFDISGVIRLEKRLWIGNPYLIIDGVNGTCPVIITNELFYIRANDVIIRYITVASNRKELNMDSMWIYRTYNVLIDHVSVYYGTDETLSVTHSDNVVITNSIIANTLDINNHAFGVILSGEDENAVTIFKGNVIANCSSRTPSYGTGHFFVTNNLIYNFGHRVSYSSNLRKSIVFMMNNYYKPGPNTKENYIFRFPNKVSEMCVFVDNNYIHGDEIKTNDNTLAVKDLQNGLLLKDDGKGLFKILKKFQIQKNLKKKMESKK